MVSKEEVEKRINNWIEKQGIYYKKRKFICDCCGKVIDKRLKYPGKFVCKKCVNNGALEIMKLKKGEKITNEDFKGVIK